MSSSEATTRNIRVHVEAEYDPGRSSPQESQWFFLYTVQITNEGPDTVQLISRHWVITDGAERCTRFGARASSEISRPLRQVKALSTPQVAF